jgi:eukaryotic translation initiation factor 2C
MIQVQGKMMKPPRVHYNPGRDTRGLHYNQTQVSESDVRDGAWRLTNKGFTMPVEGTKWTFLQLEVSGGQGSIPLDQLKWATGQLQNRMTTWGLLNHERVLFNDGVNHELSFLGNGSSSSSYQEKNNEEELRKRLELFYTQNRIRLVLIVLPRRSANTYALVKRIAEVHVGIHTMCISSEKVNKLAEFNFAGNVLLKYNLRLGGVNHWLNNQEGVLGKRTMFTGIDVTHPSPGSLKGAPSIAAVVATEESKYFVQWPASFRLQVPEKEKKSREIVDELKEMLVERLIHWKSMNNSNLPDQIIFYRDGVSDSFITHIKEFEWPQIESAISEVYLNKPRPKWAYFVTVKRHSLRLFRDTNITAGRFVNNQTGNVNPGLLVEEKVTRWGMNDFFLQAHKCLKGSSNAGLS